MEKPTITLLKSTRDGKPYWQRVTSFELEGPTEIKRFRTCDQELQEIKMPCPKCGKQCEVWIDNIGYPVFGAICEGNFYCHDCCLETPIEYSVEVSICIYEETQEENDGKNIED